MHIHNLYEDEQGESHWRDIAVTWIEMTPSVPASSAADATVTLFRQMPASYDLDWHPAPRKQYVIQLDGDVLITASDGEARTVRAGEVMLLEDVDGKGHRSKNLVGRPYHVMFV